MGSRELRTRSIWQDYSGKNASIAENSFYNVFTDAFSDSDFHIRSKPAEFQKIYVNVPLDSEVLDEIYTPDKPITKHGITPDYAIDNPTTGKTLYVEVKRQDGWVEGKPRSAGRGNAHERSNKFFTPGLIRTLRNEGNIQEPHLPFWTVFIGDITRDPCRVREVTLWYRNYESHFFFWRNQKDPRKLLDHFDLKLKHLFYE